MTIVTTTDPSQTTGDGQPDAAPARTGRGLGITALVVASLGVAGLALYRDPAVRTAVRDVATDSRVRAAANELRHTITGAWRDHGGTAAAAEATRRGARSVRLP